MIIVTGGAGFIGSNLIEYLNNCGRKDIIVIDDLTNGHKFNNLKDLQISDYLDKDDVDFDILKLDAIDKVFHCGAISSTTEWNGKKVMKDNYEFTCRLFWAAYSKKIPFVYTSSASVYGNSKTFNETDPYDPLNVYAYSKRMSEQYIIQASYGLFLDKVWVFRPFNVYGPREDYKGDQASPVTKFRKQFEETGYVEVFEGSENIYRDFICVDDVVKIMVDYTNGVGGLFNLGTGQTESFYNIARAITGNESKVKIVPFPEILKDKYQYYSKADISHLKRLVDDYKFISVLDYLGGQNETNTPNTT
jgi:ADP-L-glycero-D-manno-heptose 6-epimerase